MRINKITYWEMYGLQLYLLLTLVQVESQDTEEDSVALHVQVQCEETYWMMITGPLTLTD